ncbi:MAG TPA: alkaline phosphatase family protein [Acidobacteriaceae bacterium]|nr:alkaline phosphatase family protein [Acidobacteriaceae bacterium]
MTASTPKFFLPLFFATASLVVAPFATAQDGLNTGEPQILSTGQRITPLAPRGASFQPLNPGLLDAPSYTVGQAVSTTISPDGKTLLVLTSGYNLWNFTSGAQAGNTNPADSSEWVFVFDISTDKPIQKQAISVPNTYNGIAWSPLGTEFFVSGGDNDNVHIYNQVAGAWTEEPGSPVALQHNPAPPLSSGGLGLITPPEAAGLAVSSDGNSVVVANYENDSITELVKQQGVGWIRYIDYDLRPGKQSTSFTGVPGGEYPFWVQSKGSSTAYISSVRDRQIVVLTPQGVIARIPVPGQPNKMVMNKAQSLLYVAQDNAPGIAVIDTNNNVVIDEIQPPSIVSNSTKGGANNFLGANPNSLALSPDEKTLYVTEGGLNAVAVYHLGGVGGSTFAGFIPTGFYPNSVSVSPDGKMLYIVNGKSATGPNPQNCTTAVANAQAAACNASNTYIWQITKAGFQTVPVPTSSELATLTQKVVTNDNIGGLVTAQQQEVMTFLHNHIQHVIYIIKENRTYDQVLGDLEVGNGDPLITQFPEANTPNFHAIARNFVDFDNFFDVSDVSGDGWPWSTSARTTDVIEKEIPVNYAGRGIDNDSEGTNRNLNVGIGNTLQRYAADPLTGTDPDLLPGNANVAAPDSEDGSQGQGYLWNGALKAGLTVRNYGFFLDLARYNLTVYPPLNIPEDPNAYADHLQVAYSTNTVLSQYTDPYYRGFDNSFPDYFRFTEWQREFQGYVNSGNLPNLSFVRLMHDHFGNFATAINGVNTPELQIADNDYAVASVIQAVNNSPYKSNTLIFVIEDDAQDGGDHVDAHRSTAFIVGPYVKKQYVDSTRYNTVNFLATIEGVLGIAPLNINDANAAPMINAFNINADGNWKFTATPSSYLAMTTLPIPGLTAEMAGPRPLHNAEWWAAHTKGMDFSVEDHLDSAKFNRVVWGGVMGANKAYPYFRTGTDLSQNRSALLAKYHAGKLQMVKPTQEQRTEAELESTARANRRDHDDDEK